MTHYSPYLPKEVRKPTSVWLLTIMFKGGTEFYIFPNRQLALDQLEEYVLINTADDEDFDSELQLSQREIIEVYFNHNEAESYTLMEEEVLTEIVPYNRATIDESCY